jgi:TolB-like protein
VVLPVALDSAVEAGALEIESVLPSGSKVAVLYFSSSSEAFSNYVIEELMGYLVRDRKVVVVDRNSLDIIRREQNFQLSGEVDDHSAQAIGKMLGAQSVVAGSLVDLGGSYRFRVYTLNVETAAREAAYMSTIRPDAQITHLLNTRNTPSVASNQVPQPASVPTAPAVQSDPNMPEWLNDFPPEDALWGIGTAKQSSDNMSRVMAIYCARSSIVQQLSSIAQAMILDYEQEAGIYGSYASVSLLDSVFRSLAEDKLTDAEVIQSWKGLDGTLWCLVEYKKADAARMLADIMNTEAQNYAEFSSGDFYDGVEYYLGNIHTSGPVVSE